VHGAGGLKDMDSAGIVKPVPMMETPLARSLTPGRIKSRPPSRGEHTESLLKSLNYSEEEIADLRSKRVV